MQFRIRRRRTYDDDAMNYSEWILDGKAHTQRMGSALHCTKFANRSPRPNAVKRKAPRHHKFAKPQTERSLNVSSMRS